MIIYIEAIEDTESEELDFIQEEVKADSEVETDKEFNGVKIIKRTYSKKEEDITLSIVKSKEDSKKTYLYRKHFHRHDEGKPCTTEIINS